MYEVIQQNATKRIPLLLRQSSDHITPATGATVTVTISKNGAAFGNPSGGLTHATEVGNGLYYVDLTSTDTGTLGGLDVRATAASCDDFVDAYAVAAAAIPVNLVGATKRVPIYLRQSADHVTPATGATAAVTISKNGAAFGNPAAGATNATEIGSGAYYVDLSATDMGTIGPLVVRATAANCDPFIDAYPIGTAALTATAVFATMAAGEASRGQLIAYQNAVPGPFVFPPLVDSTGAAINLAGKTIELVVFDPSNGNAVKFTIAGGGIVVSGAGSNVITATGAVGNTPAAGNFQYDVWNTTDHVVLFAGSFVIRPTGGP